MLTWLPKPMVGVIAIILYAINFFLWFIYLFLVALCKWIIPNKKWRQTWQPALNKVAPGWVAGNNIVMLLTTRIQWDIQGLETLNPQTWYLLISNHQAWTDILVLFKILVTRISPIRYFLKEELRWVPLLGQACWILDFPFMRRHSSTAMARHPELRLQDIETTRRSCEKFKHTPITLINFAEGTRFRLSKHQKQKSPYQHLLKPKAGGIAFTLSAMDGQIKEILDVTLVYSPHRASFWDFCCGKVSKITVKIRTIPITETWVGNYLEDKIFRQQFQACINQLWQEKEETISKLL